MRPAAPAVVVLNIVGSDNHLQHVQLALGWQNVDKTF